MTTGNGKNDKGKQTTHPADPPEWFTCGAPDNFQDIDYIYGGWGQDAIQADVADEGPVAGDRLIDWVGAYNVYYLCPGVYGEYVTTRDHSPAVVEFLKQLAAGDGAYEVPVDGSSGNDELAMVYANEAGQNSHPIHPDTPGHFICEVVASSVAQPENMGSGQQPEEPATEEPVVEEPVLDDTQPEDPVDGDTSTKEGTVDQGSGVGSAQYLPLLTTGQSSDPEEIRRSSSTIEQGLFLPSVTRNR